MEKADKIHREPGKGDATLKQEIVKTSATQKISMTFGRGGELP